MSTEFYVGQRVIATGSYNWKLTTGKEYTVVKYEPSHADTTFTWPAYVTVIGDDGKGVCGHAHRFVARVSRAPDECAATAKGQQ